VFTSPYAGTYVDDLSEMVLAGASFTAAYATELGQRVAADSMEHLRGRTRLFVTEHVVVGE
jgi:hypothetical protein